MDYKIQIISKLEKLDIILSNCEFSSSEYEDVDKAVKQANNLIKGKYDSINFIIQQDLADQCMNSIDNLISRFQKRNNK